MTEATSLEDIVSPDSEIMLGGREVKVRAFRFLEGLRATPIARPLIDDLHETLTKGREVDPGAILDLLGRHGAVWVELIAISTGESIEWLSALSDAEGMSLAMTFWGVNKHFFTTRLALGEALRAAEESNPRKSSANSSPPATEETPRTSPSA